MAADVTKIADIDVTGTTTDTITFSSIPQTYKTLMIMVSSYYDRAGGSNGGLRVNGLSTTIYTSQYNYLSSNSTSGSRSNGSISGAGITYAYNHFTQSLGPSNSVLYWGNETFYFPAYTNTSQNKLAFSMGGNAAFETPSGYDPTRTGQVNYKFATTSALTQIQFGSYEASVYYRAGSKFTLYGIS
jgi:hypothetical protein